MNKIKEECGIFGIYSKKSKDKLVYNTAICLSTLQHRGEESCGIAVNKDGIIEYHKDIGLVSEVFTPKVLDNMPDGKMAIGHVRYSTTGLSKKENAQPLVIRHQKGNLAIAHNGNLVNAIELKEELEKTGSIFTTTSDTEVICQLIVKERIKTTCIEDAIVKTMKKLKGAYSLLIMTSRKLIAVRDPQGFRPLCMGKIGNKIMFASESCAFEILGGKFIRDLEPGEMVVVTNNEVTAKNYFPNERHGMCIFEYIYFARPDSIMDGISIHRFRENTGRFLAKQAPVEADIVAGVPDSGVDAALGYSKETGIPYDIVFTKSKYIGRTFIQNSQSKRQNSVSLKLSPLRSVVKGKSIILIDDSIVRGNTIVKIVERLRKAGAKKIHLRIASPPFIDACHFGTDIDNKDVLIANNYTKEEIRKMVNVDSLEYLSLENLDKLTKGSHINGFCKGCFTGKYPVAVPKEVPKNTFETINL